jgi:oligoribonuclease NrnB/cAMP/cGMP phosphodiesterase (DHH superfamily)
MPPLNGFSIKTTEGKFLSDIRPRGIVRELNRLNDRIKQLEEQLMDTKNKHAVLVADVVLNEDRAERIKRLEEAGDYLCAAAAFMGWHDKIETWNKAKEAKL